MKCKIKDLSINYEVIGEGKPIIMLHGFYTDHRVMSGCMEPILSAKEKYKRIYIDLPGMGKSESDLWIISSDNMLDIVIDFIEKVIPNENFLLAGESYGGYLSRGLIHKMADRIDGIVLICPLIIPRYNKRKVPGHVVLVKDNKLLSKLTSEEAENFNLRVVVQSTEIYERYDKEIVAGIKIANIEFLKSLRKNGYGFSFDVDNVNNKFDKPVLMLLGKQDNSVGYKDQWDILDNFPRATFAVLDRSGHNLQIEQAEIFNSLVNEWLARVNEY